MHNDPTASVQIIEFFGDVEECLPPPPLPEGYEQISAIQARGENNWACLAFEQRYGNYGLLVYGQEDGTHDFYLEEDVLHLLQHTAWTFDLLGYCTPVSVGEPGQEVFDINGPWWSKHAVFARQSMAQPQKEEHDAMD